MSDHQPQLGKPPARGAGRDAVHVAIVPLRYAGDVPWINPQASRVRRWDDDGFQPCDDADDVVGVVDPFLPHNTTLRPNDMAYICLYPGTVQGMRHVWSHPEFEQERDDTADEARRRLEDYGYGQSWGTIAAAIKEFLDGSPDACLPFDTPYGDEDEMLLLYEQATGRAVPEEWRTREARIKHDKYFVCGC